MEEACDDHGAGGGAPGDGDGDTRRAGAGQGEVLLLQGGVEVLKLIDVIWVEAVFLGALDHKAEVAPSRGERSLGICCTISFGLVLVPALVDNGYSLTIIDACGDAFDDVELFHLVVRDFVDDT